MADTKISNLTALAEAPSTADLLAIVDVTASETKKLTIANLIDAIEGAANAFTGANTFTGIQTFERIRSGTTGSMSDNTATTIELAPTGGCILIWPSNSVAVGANRYEAMALIAFVRGASPSIAILTQPATRVEVGTSALSGSSGTDGNLNIALVANATTLTVENRLGGGTTTFSYIIFG